MNSHLGNLGPYDDPIGLWDNELRAWVPHRIFDVHLHLFTAQVVGPLTPERRKEGFCAFPRFTWEDAVYYYAHLFWGKAISGMFAFPLPMREVNLEAANEYVAEVARRVSEVNGLLAAHPKDADWTIDQYHRARQAGVRVVGVKPYYDLLGKSNYECTMPEFIPEPLLEFLNKEGLILMLHTSGIGVGDRENRAYLKRVAGRYPRVRFILAHMGRYLKIEQFLDFAASKVMDFPNIYLESSYVTRREIFSRVLAQREWWPRLLFGADFPFGLWRHCERLPNEAPLLATYNVYHTIMAIREAIEGLNLSRPEAERLKRRIFYENAQTLLSNMPL